MRVLAVVVLAMLLFGCGTNFTGAWVGYGSLTRGAQGPQEYVTLTLTANGNQVTGTWTAISQGSTQGSQGAFTAVADGKNLTAINWAVQSGQCQGSLTGSGTWNNSQITFTLAGTLGFCGQVNTSLTLTDTTP